MLRSRVIPCLLVHNGGLVKTRRFSEPRYVGDPINAVKIFNEKEVDELIVLDIDASAKRLEPNYTLIKHLAAECRMPLCYGGGVKSVEQAQRIINMGVEKIAISSSAHEDPDLVARMAEAVGNQSVVVVMDVLKDQLTGRYEVRVLNGKRPTGKTPVDFAKRVEQLGAGEIVVNSIDNDGVMAGYDLALAADVRNAVGIPLTVLGGAGSLEHVRELSHSFGTIGAAAGSLFVFKGSYRAVLISYPSRAEKDALIA